MLKHNTAKSIKIEKTVAKKIIKMLIPDTALSQLTRQQKTNNNLL